ncbi:MAG: hypothetical protein ABSF23_07250 [Terracidiphilus sp.]|jgi:hypothetical protein
MHEHSGFSGRFILALIVLGFASLSAAHAQQQKAPAVQGIPVQPGFTVKVTYSQKAMSTLVTRKETVVVAGYLYGFPKQGTPKRLIDEIGQVDLGEIKQEVVPGAMATFDKIKPDQTLLKWLDSQGLQLLINVFSGRKSTQDNLLDCGIYEGSLQSVQGKSIPISCKLIGE